MTQSPSHARRGPRAFERTALDCIEAFAFLVEDLEFTTVGMEFNARGFVVRFRRESIGVEVGYKIRDRTVVDICLLGADGGFPQPLGELRPDTEVNRFDLADVESQVGLVRAVEPLEYAVPTKGRLVIYAQRLKRSSRAMLMGDTSLVPALRARVLARGREAAFDKWGARAAEFGW